MKKTIYRLTNTIRKSFSRPSVRSLAILLLALPLALLLYKKGAITQTACAQTVSNLLQNPSFENTGSAWLSPWTLLTRNGAAASIIQDSSNPACGNYSAHATVTATSPNPWDVELYQGNIPITQGQTLTLTFFAKASAPRTINAMLEQNYGSYNAYFNQAIQISTTWQQYTVTYTPTVSDSNTLFTFNLAQATGDMWIDNAVMSTASIPTPTTGTAPISTSTPLPTNTPTPVPTNTPTPTPAPTNIVQNPSFENTGSAWLSPWTFSIVTGANGSISQATAAESGAHSAKMTISKTNANAWYLQLAQANLPFTAGRTYQVSFWAKASAARKLEWGLQQNYSPYTWYMLQTANLTTAWQRITTTYTPTASDTNIRINFDVANASPTVYVDNVSIK